MSKAWLSVIATAVLATGLASAYMYNATRKAVTGPTPTPIVVTPTDAGASGSLVISPTMASVSATPAATKPVVVFEAEGSISANDKSEIQKKILNPMIDYYATETGSGKLLTITVSANAQASKTTYPYLLKGIFDSGVNLGVTIEKDAASFKWWRPECMAGCPFTPEFKAKYPEVVE